MNRRRGACVAGATVMLLLAASPLAGSSIAAQPKAGDRAAIKELLDRRARAVLTRDEASFMATVSKRDASFVKRQRERFRWASEVPFRTYGLVAQWDLMGDLARPADRSRYPGASAVSIPLTQERYTLDRYSSRPAVEDLYLTFVKDRDRWLVASDSDLADVGLLTSRHLWDFGPVRELRSDHFSVLSHPCGKGSNCALVPGELLALAESALDRVVQRWGLPWRKRVVLLLPSSFEELSEMIQATFELDDFVAFATSTVDLKHDFRYGGHRIVFNPAGLGERSQESLLLILTHELTHVATRSVSGPFVPTFVEEGLAEYVSRGPDAGLSSSLAAQIGAQPFRGTLPDNWRFVTGSGADIYRSYVEAQSAIRFLADRWGRRSLERFYRALGRPHVAPGTTAYHLDRALRSTVGVGRRRFERLWAASIVDQ